MTDHELLAEHGSGASAEAFTELVRRHLPLVLSTARRRLTAPDQADDVAQQVFTLFARKARSLPSDVILAGWLYRTTCLVAGDQNRSDRRRLQREHQSVTAMNESASDSTWREIQPLLDEAMTCLTERDRDAVVLRYFEDRSLKEVGDAMGISPDAAQKRLSRSLERLRESLARKHRVVTPAALGAAITAGAIQATPGSVQAATIAATALSAASTGFSLSTASLIAMSTLKTLTVGVVSAALVTALVLQQKRLHEAEAERERAVAAAEAATTSPFPTTTTSGSTGVDPELLRLRGEVARLRGLSNELASLRRENSRLQSLRTVSSPISESLGDGARQGIEKMQYLKAWMYAFHQYLEGHDGVFPKSFEEVTAAGFQVADGPGFSSSELEILYKGRLDEVKDPARIIVLRERELFRDPAGNGFNRTYAFADGHVEIHHSPDEDFATWEREHSQFTKGTPPTRGL